MNRKKGRIMKTVVLCIPNLLTGGAEKFVVDLAENIDKKKFKVYVAITRDFTESVFKKRLVNCGIDIVDLSSTNYLKMTVKQLRFWKKTKPDVVHANIGSILHVMLSTKLARIPKKLYTLHNEAKLLYGDSRVRKIFFHLAFTIFGFTPIAICDFIKESYIKAFNYKSEKIPVVHNGVDIEKFFPKQKENDDFLRIITTGTVYWIKNQKLLVEAVRQLSKEYSGFKVSILGDGADYQKMISYINEMELNNIIEMPGMCSDVNRRLQESDIYVSTSLTEGLPISILEAMACGLPIVASNAGGTIDIVYSNQNGILYEKNNLEELINGLKLLLDNKDIRIKYGRESRKIAEQWNVESCTEGYQKLYLR